MQLLATILDSNTEFEDSVVDLQDKIRLLIQSPNEEDLRVIDSYAFDEFLSCLLANAGNLDATILELKWYNGFQMFNGQDKGSVERVKLVCTAISRLNIGEIEQLRSLLRDLEAQSNGFNNHNHRYLLTTTLGQRMNNIAQLFKAQDQDLRRIASNFFSHFNSYDEATRERYEQSPNPNKGELYGAILALSNRRYCDIVERRLIEAETVLGSLREV